MSENQREKEEAKKRQQRRHLHKSYIFNKNPSEDFQKCQVFVNILLLSHTEQLKLINLVNQSSNTINNVFSQIRGKLDEIINHRRGTVDIDIFFSWIQEMSSYNHHHHHVKTLLCHHVTPFLTMEYHLHRVTPLLCMDRHHHQVTPLY